MPRWVGRTNVGLSLTVGRSGRLGFMPEHTPLAGASKEKARPRPGELNRDQSGAGSCGPVLTNKQLDSRHAGLGHFFVKFTEPVHDGFAHVADLDHQAVETFHRRFCQLLV